MKFHSLMLPHGTLIPVIVGSLVWLALGSLALLGLIGLSLLEQLFLLAPLVITPLSLPLLRILEQQPLQYALYRAIRAGQPVCALLAAVAFLLPPGLPAGALALAWLGLTGLAALLGLLRLVARASFDTKELVIDASLAYLAIGGGWLVLSRLGINPLGFDETIILLTAVHFHYAGFAAPLITGLTGHALSAANRSQKLYRGSALGVIAGTPLVAAGITLSPLVEVVGAVILATSLAGIAYLTRYLVLRVITGTLARTFLTISAVCLLAGMLFTYLYALGEFSGYPLVSIPQMVIIHGMLNSLGFALFGLLGWTAIYGASAGV